VGVLIFGRGQPPRDRPPLLPAGFGVGGVEPVGEFLEQRPAVGLRRPRLIGRRHLTGGDPVVDQGPTAACRAVGRIAGECLDVEPGLGRGAGVAGRAVGLQEGPAWLT